MKLVYIAGPFRGETLAEIDRNICVASMFVAPIAQAGCMPICVHLCEGLRAHDIHQENRGQFWVDATLEVLRRCDAVVVIPGWANSEGTRGEIDEAIRLGLPVFEAKFEVATNDVMPRPGEVLSWGRLGGFSESGLTTFNRWAQAQEKGSETK